jgi:hypothetical protein
MQRGAALRAPYAAGVQLPRRTRSLARRCARATATPRASVELLVLDFERGISAGGGALQARGLGAALAYTSLPFYVLADAPPAAQDALRDVAGVELSAQRIFARSLSGLLAVAARPLAADPATRCHLVTADASLLAAAAAEPRLAAWRLHAAAWPAGGAAETSLPSSASAPPQRAAALTLDSLVELLNFGLLMGVGDGCQEKFDAAGNELESN